MSMELSIVKTYVAILAGPAGFDPLHSRLSLQLLVIRTRRYRVIYGCSRQDCTLGRVRYAQRDVQRDTIEAVCNCRTPHKLHD